jgi:hypothetical protein
MALSSELLVALELHSKSQDEMDKDFEAFDACTNIRNRSLQ